MVDTEVGSQDSDCCTASASLHLNVYFRYYFHFFMKLNLSIEAVILKLIEIQERFKKALD